MPNAKKLNERAREDGRGGGLRAARGFTDRDDLRAAYHALVDRAVAEKFDGYYVVNYYGLGGIGKSTLLAKLRDEVRERAAADAPRRHIALMLDFDSVVADLVPALEHLKAQLQAQNFNFPLFELALYALYEKSGRVMSAPERETFFERNPMIDAVVDAAGALPVIGLVAALGKSVVRIAGNARNVYQRALNQRKGSLYEIETMDARALRGNLPLLFAQDVNEQLDDGAMLHLFIDTYERLVSVAEGEQGAHSAIRNDDWLYGRDGLIRNLGNAVFAIAGREKLHWPESSEFWAEEGRLESHLTDHLSEENSGRFLGSCGVDSSLWHALYELTDGQPVYLDLCVDQYCDVLDAGREPTPDDFGRNVEMLVERHNRYIPEHQRDALYLMAGMRRWNRQIFDLAASAAGISINPSEYRDRLTRLSYVTDEGGGTFAMHQVVAKILSSKLNPDVARPASVALAKLVQTEEGAELALDAAVNLAGENARSLDLARALEAQARRAHKNLQFRQALELRQRAAEVCHAVLGEEHSATLAAKLNLADSDFDLGEYRRARELREQVYEARRRLQGEEHPDTLDVMDDLAVSYSGLGEYRRALELEKRVYAARRCLLGEEHLATLDAMSNLAACYNCLGDYRRARELQERACEAYRRVPGEEPPNMLNALNNLAFSYIRLGECRRAQGLWEQIYEARKRLLGEEHPDTLVALNNLANSCSELGDHARARELRERVYEARKRVLGEEHPATLSALNNLATSCGDLGEHQRARELKERVCEASRRILGEEHPNTLTVLSNLAISYSDLEEYQRALELRERVYAARKRTLGEEHPDTLAAMNYLVASYSDLGEYQRALALAERVYEARKRLLGEKHPNTLSALSNLAVCYSNLGEHQRALEMEERVYEARKRVLGEAHPDTLSALSNLAISYKNLDEC